LTLRLRRDGDQAALAGADLKREPLEVRGGRRLRRGEEERGSVEIHSRMCVELCK
jgi:hypothetical protein